MTDQYAQLRALARDYPRRSWAILFTAPVPDCWTAAFLRPARRVRTVARSLVRSTGAGVHLRLCNLVNWKDTCAPVESPHAAARTTLDCAAKAANTTSFFVASDSSLVLNRLKHDARAGNLSLPNAPTPTRVMLSTLDGLGSAAHLSRLRRHQVDPQTSLDRAVFDWAAFAYSHSVVALPSSFPASAVCMFSPGTISFTVHRLPGTNGQVDCQDPLATSTRSKKHPCHDLVRVNSKVLRRANAVGALPRALHGNVQHRNGHQPWKLRTSRAVQ